MSEKQVSFNYIITIHNKENLIKDVLLAVIAVAGPHSCIYPVLDGCFDKSELIIDEIISMYPDCMIKKIFANDVHELKSINVGLGGSNQNGRGYNIILQDDVVLKDILLEQRCIAMYDKFDKLGIVSFRHGANLSRELILDRGVIEPFTDYIQSEFGHYPKRKQMLKKGAFIFREIVIKSPICIPFQLIREFGKPDENYAPWDDIAYCYKVSSAGYQNGVFAIEFQSEVAWGTTRNKHQKYQVEDVMLRNLDLFRSQCPVLPALDKVKYGNEKPVIFFV